MTHQTRHVISEWDCANRLIRRSCLARFETRIDIQKHERHICTKHIKTDRVVWTRSHHRFLVDFNVVVFSVEPNLGLKSAILFVPPPGTSVLPGYKPTNGDWTRRRCCTADAPRPIASSGGAAPMQLLFLSPNYVHVPKNVQGQN